MAGTMSEADLVADLKASLQDSASVFTAAADADFKRHLKTAAKAFGKKRSRTLVSSLTLTADQPAYAAPEGFLAFKSHLWGISPVAKCQPWEKNWPGRLPDVRYAETEDGASLYLDPAPTAFQISALGAEFRYYYFAGHVIGSEASGTSILDGERDVLLLRAQAEAMREMAMRNIMKPVQMREGIASQARNGTPAALYKAMLDEFNAYEAA